MALQYLTLAHIVISIAGIASGFGLLSGLISDTLFPRWTNVFLATSIATSVTGFFFPFHGITPGIAIGVISLIALAVACYAYYVRRLNGVWRRVFVITAVMALYLNVFVLVAQLFQKNPALAEIAPDPSSPLQVVTQAVVLGVFVWLGIIAVRRFGAVPARQT